MPLIMLILSRKENQSIMINDNIEITIIEIRDHVIALGIEAPKEIGVHRKEIYQAIQAGTPSPKQRGRKD